MAFGDFAGGVLRERDRAASRDIASRGATVAEGQLELGRDRLGQAQNQFQAAQASAATQQLLKASKELADNIEKIIAEGGTPPPSTVKAAEQFVEALKDQPNAQQQVISLFAAARSAATPTQAAVRGGQATVAGVEAITGVDLTDEDKRALAGLDAPTREKLFILQDAREKETNPKRKAEIDQAIQKLISKSAGISINTGPQATGAFAIADKGFLDNISERGLAADDTLRNVEIIMVSLDELGDGPLSTGALAGFRGTLANFAETFNLSDEFSTDLANLSQIESLSNKMTIAETQALSGAINKQEFIAAGKIPPNIENTPLANVYLAKRMEALALYDAKRLEVGQAIAEANPDMTNTQIAKALRAEFKNVPWLSKNKRTIEGLPIFFFDFVADAHSKNPNISIQKLARAFRKGDRKAGEDASGQ